MVKGSKEVANNRSFSQSKDDQLWMYLVLVTAEHVEDGVEDLHVQLLKGQQLLLAPVPIHRCLSIAPPPPNLSILRHSGICGAADDAVLNKVQKNPKNFPVNFFKPLCHKYCIAFANSC
jgi:hypothetical protein